MEDNVRSAALQPAGVLPPGAGNARAQLLAALPVAERCFELNGISTSVIEGGSGAPIVFLHGAGGFAANWMRVLPSLVATHRVIAPDLPGHGASTAANGRVDVEQIIGWLDDLIDCTCAARPVLCGNTLGGAIAARYASARSERLAGLVLVDTLGLRPFQPAPDFGIAIRDYMTFPSEETHERLWRQCAFDLDAMRTRIGESWKPFKAYDLDRARAAELKPTQQCLMEQFAMPGIAPGELAKISVPTTLIWGTYDRATPLSVARAASTTYGWPLHVIDNAADEPGLEQPDAFVAALEKALARSSSVGGDRAAWNRIASAYDDFVTSSHLSLGTQAVSRAGLAKGMQFLDVASGSGALSIPAAQRGANVVAVDIAPTMLARLRDRAAAARLDIETLEMDGQALALESDRFDVTGSQFGAMLFPDLPAGLREMVRVTKPGGRVMLVVFGPPQQIEFFDCFVQAMREAVADFVGPPMDPPPLPFQVSDKDVLRKRMTEAGLRDVAIDTITETLEFGSGLQLWNWLIGSNPLATMLTSGLSSDQVPIVQDALERLIRARAAAEATAILKHPVHIAVGVK